MNPKNPYLLLGLGLLLLGGAFFLFHRQSATKTEVSAFAAERDQLDLDIAVAQITIAREQDRLDQTPDSIVQARGLDTAHAAFLEQHRQADSRSEELSAVTIPVLQKKLLWEQTGMWVCGICGLVLLGISRRAGRLTRNRTEQTA
jgi:hypothetical protein